MPKLAPGRSAESALEVLRTTRTAALWLASPAEQWWRRLWGRERLPPLWLRRHVGPVSQFESAARATADWIDKLGLLKPGDLVLDIGCGCGAMVGELARRFGPAGLYVGFDVHAPSIRWCRKHFESDPRLRFELADLRSPYGGGTDEVGSYQFPIEDASTSFVLAKSVFTHLLEPEAEHYLREIARVLSPEGRALVSAFLFQTLTDSDPPPLFPHPSDPHSPVRWRLAARPRAAVAYDHAAFTAMIQAAGLEIETLIQGFFPGHKPTLDGQDQLVLRRAGAMLSKVSP
ncbi:MAG: methyltransferase domain-containing protein [Thermoanaerobaculia bacterium]|nr:methyltransferase domain-containing protein [Thermoanaerobaculia bacterium]